MHFVVGTATTATIGRGERWPGDVCSYLGPLNLVPTRPAGARSNAETGLGQVGLAHLTSMFRVVGSGWWASNSKDIVGPMVKSVPPQTGHRGRVRRTTERRRRRSSRLRGTRAGRRHPGRTSTAQRGGLMTNLRAYLDPVAFGSPGSCSLQVRDVAGRCR